MFCSTLLLVITIATSTVCLANEPAETQRRLHVYRVGNIVSETAMKAVVGGKSTSGEWAAEYAETTKALEDLRELVEPLCCREAGTVVIAHTPSLSLIVRHSEEGHKEVEKLLNQLGAVHGPMIQLERTLVATEASEESKAAFAKLTDAEQQRYAILQAMKKLTKAETAELQTLMDRIPGVKPFKETILLKPGQRTPFEISVWPATAMVRLNQEKRTIDIRIDAINDDIGEVVAFSTHVLSLAEGESARSLHFADGGLVGCRIMAKEVPPRAQFPELATVSSPTTAPSLDDDEGISELAMVMSRRFASNGTDAENAREEIRARLVLHDHRVKYGEGVYSLGVEFENQSMTHFARIEFNPMDPKLELFDAQDRAVPEGPKLTTGPVPQTQVAIIPPGSFVVFSTNEPGIGLNGEKKRLGAGGQVWKLATGTYRLRGTIPAKVQFEKPRFDETQRGTALPPDKWPATGEKENLAIPLSTFTIP